MSGHPLHTVGPFPGLAGDHLRKRTVGRERTEGATGSVEDEIRTLGVDRERTEGASRTRTETGRRQGEDRGGDGERRGRGPETGRSIVDRCVKGAGSIVVSQGAPEGFGKDPRQRTCTDVGSGTVEKVSVRTEIRQRKSMTESATSDVDLE